MRTITALLCVGIVSLIGCAPAAEPAPGVGGASGFGGAGGFGGVGGAGGGVPSTGCTLFETAACMCGTFPGRRVCSVGSVWSDCACDGDPTTGGTGGGDTPLQEPPGNKLSNVMWSWAESAPTGSCRPGHYEGTFAGLYASSLTVVGAPIPVFPVDVPGAPGLQFDLVVGAGGGEILEIQNGKMKGNALGAFPFEFDMEGALDCSTFKFEAELVNGFYSLGGVGRFEMSGPIVADYDPLTGTMTNGHWIVTEPGSMPPWGSTTPWYGGEGDWSARFIRP